MTSASGQPVCHQRKHRLCATSLDGPGRKHRPSRTATARRPPRHLLLEVARRGTQMSRRKTEKSPTRTPRRTERNPHIGHDRRIASGVARGVRHGHDAPLALARQYPFPQAPTALGLDGRNLRPRHRRQPHSTAPSGASSNHRPAPARRKGLCVYAALTIDKNRTSTAPLGILVVTRTIAQADEIVATIRELVSDPADADTGASAPLRGQATPLRDASRRRAGDHPRGLHASPGGTQPGRSTAAGRTTRRGTTARAV